MSFLARLKQLLLDTLFPMHCVGCGSNQSFLCESCLATIPLRAEQVCFLCTKRPTSYGQSCFACLESLRVPSALDGVLVASHYHDPILSKAIRLFKYRFIPSLAAPLGELLLDATRRSSLPLPDFLCAVPLHSLRERWRGFNQSALLATALGERLLPNLQFPIIHELKRVTFTPPQASLRSAEERHRNLKDAFAWQSSSKATTNTNPHTKETLPLQGKIIWLIDDVATTTATLEACATVLKKQGAKKVFGIVLAR